MSTSDQSQPPVPDDYVRDDLFVGGGWATAHSPRMLSLISPSTEQIIGQVPDGDATDVDTAVQAAREAFADRDRWRGLPAAIRAAAMERLADELLARRSQLSVAMAHGIGRPMSSPGVGRPSEILRYFAMLARTLVFEEVRPTPDVRPASGVRRTVVRWEPRGVTAAIVPYNGTLMLGMYKIGPTLAAGGTLVLKPPPQAPLEAYIFADAAQAAGIPAGVINVVPGGRETGELLVAHPGVDVVGFTGSTAAGRAIAAVCGAALKPVTLELGGKSAAIVLEDADLERLTGALPTLCFTFTGQNCFIHSRILVVRSRYEEVLERVVAVARSYRIGDPFDPATQLGPLISAAHRDHVEACIAGAVAGGARVETGGGRPGHLPRGWYLEPTVLTGVDPSMPIAREETFGPVISVIPVADEDEAVRVANDSDFGLAGSVWTADVARGQRVATRVDTGSIGVNVFGFNSAAPFSGRRGSGLGTELGPEGLAAYLQPQAVHHTGP